MSRVDVKPGEIGVPARPARPARRGLPARIVPFLQTYGSLLAFVLLLAVATWLSPTFLSAMNIRQQLISFSLSVGLIAVGQTLVILTGGIDLSVGSLLAVGSVLAATLVMADVQTLVVFVAPIAVATALGCMSGLIVAKARVQPIVVTLAMMIGARGVAEVLTGDRVLMLSSDRFASITAGALGPIPNAVMLVGAVYLVAVLVLGRTSLGRYILATGGNEEAARLSGIAVGRVKIAVYAISGFLAGLAGVLYASYNQSADPQNDGFFFELTTIAAVVAGGTSLLGGRGNVWRTLVGGLLISVLNALLIQRNMEVPDQLIAQGLIIAGAVMLQRGG
jgi:ribose transport system permease protein